MCSPPLKYNKFKLPRPIIQSFCHYLLVLIVQLIHLSEFWFFYRFDVMIISISGS